MQHAELTRECKALKIPEGERVVLPAGVEVYITQSLGGSFTVQAPSHGGMYRISGRDADALGQEVPEEVAGFVPEGPLEEQITAALKTCYDPEIPVNIIDLGLVYDTRISEVAGGKSHVDVKMTLTAVGCGMGPSIAADAEDRLCDLADVDDARVEIVWDPPWNPQMISEEGRKKLGIG